MLNLIKVDRPLKVNDMIFENSDKALEYFKDYKGKLEIVLNFKEASKVEKEVEKVEENKAIYRIEVRQYMTREASIGFDFMAKFNNNKPMPLRIMYGEVLEENRGMVRMKLHGRAERDSVSCSHCLRKLTHPVSMIYGIGPVCGGHYWESNPATEKRIEDKEAIFKEMDEKLREITWEGWIIKKAITKKEVVEYKKVDLTA